MSMFSRLRLRSHQADPPGGGGPDETDGPGEAQTDGAAAGSLLPRTPRQRIYLALFATVLGLLVISVLWIVVTGLVARARLDAVEGELDGLRSAVSAGKVADAQQISHHIAEQTASAHALTSGPAWWVGSNIPIAGTPLRTGRTVAYQADLIGRNAVPGVIDLTNEIVKAPHTRGTIDLTPLEHATKRLSTASRTVATAYRVISATDPSWLPLVSGPRNNAVQELRDLNTQVSRANEGLRAALPMLGSQRPQRYFLGFMNEAESRALGGLPGAFAIITADRGRIRFTHFGTDNDLLGVQAKISTSAEFRALYKQNDPTGDIRNSDISPNFSDAARIWAGMWKAKSGERVDGAIAIDPSAIGYLLAATGPATLPDGFKVTSTNVVELTQSKQYTLYGSNSVKDTLDRKKFLVSVASAVAHQTLAAGSARGLAGAARLAVHQRRLMVWSADPARERIITHFGLGGVLDPGDEPFSAFFLNNAAGGKMDFYLHAAMSYHRDSCRAGATTTASLRLLNDAPPYPLPPYVTTVLGAKPKGAKPGFSRLIVAYYATPGSRVTSVTVNGVKQVVATAPESGLVTVRLLVDMPIHATQTVTVTTTEPAARGPVQIVRQPLVHALAVSDNSPRCS